MICLAVMIMPGVQKPHCSAVLIPEGFLHGIELSVGGQALDGEDVASVGLDGEHGAALDGLAVDVDGAGAADGGLAADVRAGESGDFAQVVNEQQAGARRCRSVSCR